MKEFLLAIVIILLIASFTIFFLQKVNYAPVRRLRDRAKLISPDAASYNELETIAGALDYLSTQNSSCLLYTSTPQACPLAHAESAEYP